MAAVRPAGPDPMMTTSRTVMRVLLARGRLRRSGFALAPAEPAGDHQDSAQCAPGRPHVALVHQHEAAEGPDRGQHQRRDEDDAREQAEDDGPSDGLRRLHRALAHQRDRAVDGVGGVSGPVAHRVLGCSPAGQRTCPPGTGPEGETPLPMPQPDVAGSVWRLTSRQSALSTTTMSSVPLRNTYTRTGAPATVAVPRRVGVEAPLSCFAVASHGASAS